MKITDLQGTVKLNNGVEMPYFGLGVFQSKAGEEVENAVRYAVDAGYRSIDTAAIYKNEEGVGKAIRNCGVDREELFITSKVWNSDQGYDSTIKAYETSLMRLGLDYLDLYLIHWPKDLSADTWRAMEHLYREGKVRAIGVSNFLQHHLEDLLETAEVTPMVNQMEFHPRLVQQDLVDFCHAREIRYEAWSPLMQGKIFEVNELQDLAAKYGKTVVQVVLRWNLQKGVITIPKSVKKERIIDNANIFDFKIKDEDMQLIDSLDRHERVGPDPDNFNF